MANTIITCRSCSEAYANARDLPAYITTQRAILLRALSVLDDLEGRYTTRITPKVEAAPKPAPAAPKPAVDRNAIVEGPDDTDPGWDWQNEAGIVASAPSKVDYSETYIAAPAPLPSVRLGDAWEE